MTIDPQRRSALLGVKLATLVREHAGDGAPVQPGTIAGGAALRRGDEAWVLADEHPARYLGPALLWAARAGAGHLHLLAEDATGLLARRARFFRDAPTVWRIDGRTLHPAEPEPAPMPMPPPERVMHLVDMIRAAGAEPITEHGVLAGEVAGLEVCRAVIDPYLDVVRLEVGVGIHDREAFQIIHGDVPTAEALSDVVAKVAVHRMPSSPAHPLNRLGAERLLRAGLIAAPDRIGLRDLAATSPPVPRENVKDPVPCVAVGHAEPGRPAVVVVCSTGIDLDLVPFAADARDALGLGDAELWLVVPERDAHAVTHELAALLVHPAKVVGVAVPSRP